MPKRTNSVQKRTVPASAHLTTVGLRPLEADVNLRWPKLALNYGVWSPLFSNNPSN